ncbi:MAG: TonB-dependent receptor [Rhodothermales bacterium]|nr:TonB-dependent receptor [Rhodothermales bacterium]
MPFKLLSLPRYLAATLLLCSLIPAYTSFGQNAIVRGFITDFDNGEPLEGVNVVLRGTTFHGSVSDRDGVYVVSQIPPGDYILEASYIGYETYSENLSLAAGITVTLSYALVPDLAFLDEIIVEDEAPGEGAANVVAGQQTIRPRDIDLIPTPDVSGDLANYLTALPGVVSTGDRGGQLFIRGGEPTQNLVLLDGIPIYQPFHVVGFFSAFPSDVISRAELFAGGYGSEYGGRLSSVLDVSSRNGNKQDFGARLSIAPFVSTATLEGPLATGSVSFLASIRESVVENGVERVINQELPYRFGDRLAKLHAVLTNKSRISVTALSTYDRARIGEDLQGSIIDIDRTTNITWENRALGVRYVMLPSALPMLGRVNMSVSQLRTESGPIGDPDRLVSVTQYSTSADVSYSIGQSNYDWGIFTNTYTLDSQLGGQYQNIDFNREFVTEVGAYVKTVVYIGSGLQLSPGLRIQAFPSKAQTFYEPRLRAVYVQGPTRFSAAAGKYHQEIVGLNDRRDIGNVFTAWTASPRQDVPSAWHFIAGVQRSLNRSMEVSLEGYYKDMSNLFISEWTALPRFNTNLQNADGWSSGADLRFEIDKQVFYSLVSYGFSVTEYEAKQRTIPIWFGNESEIFNPPHDRRHQITVLSKLRTSLADLNVQWKFGSGLPYNQVLGFDGFIFMDGPVDLFERPAVPRVIYDRPYDGRLPTYHRLDVNLERTFNIGPNANLAVNAGVINTYNRDNLFYFDLFTLGRVNQLPFVPSLGLKLEVGS